MHLVFRLAPLTLALFLAGARLAAVADPIDGPALSDADVGAGTSAVAALDSDGDEPCSADVTQVPEPPSDGAPLVSFPAAPQRARVSRWPAPRPPPEVRRPTEI